MQAIRKPLPAIALMLIGAFLVFRLDRSDDPVSGAESGLLVLAIVLLLVWALTSEVALGLLPGRRPKMVMRDPEIVSYDFQVGASPPDTYDFAVLGIHNDRAGGGDAAVARGVVPEVTIFDVNGKEAFRHKGWDASAARDFSPGGEEHRLYVATKVRSEGLLHAVISANVNPLSPGPVVGHPGMGLEVRVTLRGHNVKPVTARYLLRSNGAGQKPSWKSRAPYEQAVRNTTGWRGWLRRTGRRLQP